MKTIQICLELHRELAIAAAKSGSNIRFITDQAIRFEIARMNEVAREKKVGTKSKKVGLNPKKASVKV